MPPRRLFKAAQDRTLPINRMLPNFLTLIGLSAGLTSIHFGLEKQWEAAVLAIAVAAFFDGLDGRIARLFEASKFGAELDSLSDFLCFGVAPALLLYLWTMRTAVVGSAGWSRWFSPFAPPFAWRDSTPPRTSRTTLIGRRSFSPASHPRRRGHGPAADGPAVRVRRKPDPQPLGRRAFLLSAGALLVSRVPTFSFKRIKVPKGWILPTMMITGILTAFAVSAFWLTLAMILIAYMATFPVSIARHRALAAGKTASANNATRDDE